MPDDRPTFDYATPQRDVKNNWVPYLIFALCAVLTATSYLVGEYYGGREVQNIAVVVGIFSSLGAIVLPLLIQLRRK